MLGNLRFILSQSNIRGDSAQRFAIRPVLRSWYSSPSRSQHASNDPAFKSPPQDNKENNEDEDKDEDTEDIHKDFPFMVGLALSILHVWTARLTMPECG